MTINVGDELQWIKDTGGMFTRGKRYRVEQVLNIGYTSTPYVVYDDNGKRHETDAMERNWIHFPAERASIASKRAVVPIPDVVPRIVELSRAVLELSQATADVSSTERMDIEETISMVLMLIDKLAETEIDRL